MLAFLSAVDSVSDREAFAKLYESYHSALIAAANSVLKDLQLSEDAVQEAFLSLIRHMDCINSLYSPQTKKFLFTMVRNKAIDIYRRRSSHKENYYDELPCEGEVHDLLDDYLIKEDLESLKKALLRLPLNHRIMLEYRYLYELSEKEIAKLLDIPAKRVNVSVYRARVRLLKELQKIEV